MIGASAFARIGETEQQIEARYGPSIAPAPDKFKRDELGNEIRVYNFHGFTVTVTFVNGRSEVELFVKYKDQIPSDHWEVMTGQEVAAILEAYEGTGVKWKPEQGSRRPMWWDSEDGRLKAINMFNQVQIGTVSYVEKRTERIKQNEADRLKGF